MNRFCRKILIVAMLTIFAIGAIAGDKVPVSVTRNVKDYGAVGDGIKDDTQAIQKCVDDGFDGVWYNVSRIIFPGGTYRVTHKIILWAGVQLECDPEKPATILLPANTPGYGDPSKMQAVMMSRLTALRMDKMPANHNREDPIYKNNVPSPSPCWPWKWPEDYDSAQDDAHSVHPSAYVNNNFFSQIRNLRFRVEPGNPGACVIYYNNAQGSALYNLRFDLADDTFCAIAGGPQTTECEIRGGRYGLHEMSEDGGVFNTRFIGQKEACYFAIWSSRLWVGCTFEGAPVALKYVFQPARLAMTGCEIRNCALGIDIPGECPLFIQKLKGINTPVLYRSPQRVISGNQDGETEIPAYALGLVYNEGKASSGGFFESKTILPTWNSVPAFTDVMMGANIKDFGAIGDGKADDTEAIRKAVAASEIVYVPEGSFRVTDTIMLKSKTRLIGVHAFVANILVQDNTPNFMDEKNPRPIIDTPDDPDAEVHLSQLMICSRGNSGAIAIRWRVGRKSSISWIHFNAPTAIIVTGNGGGTILNSWTATGGKQGVVIDHNKEPMISYGLCSEHQSDKAFKMTGAKNVTFYLGGFGEGEFRDENVMNEITDCDNIAIVAACLHPLGLANDDHTKEMTGFKIKNTPNIFIASYYNIHGETMKHTVIDKRPDGKVVDIGGPGSFAMYKWGDFNGQSAFVDEVGSNISWLNPLNWFGGRKICIPAKEYPEDNLSSLIPARLSSVVKLESQINGNNAILTWKTPPASDLKTVIVVRKENGYPTDAKDGKIIYSGRASRCRDVIPDTAKFAGYGVFLEDVSGKFSPGMTTMAVPVKDKSTGKNIDDVKPAQLEKGLLHYWDFTNAVVAKDETVSADKVGKTVGTLSDGSAIMPAPFISPGQIKFALALPKGIDNCGLAIPGDKISKIKGSFTISGWFFVRNEASAVRIAGNYPGGGFQPGIFQFCLGRFEGADDKNKGFQLLGMKDLRFTPGQWGAGQWNHLVATLSPKETKIYLNGELVAQTVLDFSPESGWLSSTFPFKIGGINGGEGLKPGDKPQMDRFMNLVRIYDRALSELEIKKLYWTELEKF